MQVSYVGLWLDPTTDPFGNLSPGQSGLGLVRAAGGVGQTSDRREGTVGGSQPDWGVCAMALGCPHA